MRTITHVIHPTRIVAIFLVITFATSIARAADGDKLHLKALSVKDSQVNDIEAFRLTVPADWQARGGVVWRHDLSNLAHVHMRIAAPDGKTSLDLLPIIPYTWTQGGIFGFPPGSNYLGNYVIQPLEPAQYVEKIVLPNLRNDVRWRIVSKTALPEVVKAVTPTVQEAGMQKRVIAERIRVEYAVEDDSMIEEDFYCVLVYAASPQLPGTTFWIADRLYSFRAPKGQLDKVSPLLHAMVASTRVNIKWMHAYQQVVAMWRQNVAASIQQAGALSRYIAKINDEISEINRQAYENQQKTYDRVNRQFSRYIRGVDTYESPQSSYPVDLPAGYRDAWVSDAGEYLLSNDAGLDPNVGSTITWQRLKRAED